MPLLKVWNIGDAGLAAIWKVEEPESFFLKQTGLLSDITNDKRRLEYLASRFLFKYLIPNFPLHLLQKNEFNKPVLLNNEYNLSISHSLPYIAVSVHKEISTGIDIQIWQNNIEKIKHKFLTEHELELVGNKRELLTIAWCAKEAAYKWYGKKGLSFMNNMPIIHFNIEQENNIAILFKLDKINQLLSLKCIESPYFACVYIDLITNVEVEKLNYLI